MEKIPTNVVNKNKIPQPAPALSAGKQAGFKNQMNYIGLVAEFTQQKGLNPLKYEFERSGGPDHMPLWTCNVTFESISGQLLFYSKIGPNKQIIKNNCAFMAYTYIKSFFESKQNMPYIVLAPPLVESPEDLKSKIFFLDLVKSIRTYLDTPESERSFHNLSCILDLDDGLAAARLAEMFKEGSYNPYGNGQTTTQIQLFAPRIQAATSGFTAVGTALVNKVPTAVTGDGITEADAFNAWVGAVGIILNDEWSPLPKIVPIVTKLLTLPPPPSDHPLFYVWVDKDPHKSFLKKEFFEGGFNPYGNGQTDDDTTVEFDSCDSLIEEFENECSLEDFDLQTADYSYLPAYKLEWLMNLLCYLDATPVSIETIMYKYPRLFNDLVAQHIKNLKTKEFMEGSFNPYGNGQPRRRGRNPNALQKGNQNQKPNEPALKGNVPERTNLRGAVANTPKKVQKQLRNQGTQNVPRNVQYARDQVVQPVRANRNNYPGLSKKQFLELSACAEAYAVALMCPFWFKDASCDKLVRGLKKISRDVRPCIPYPPVIKSRKMEGFVTGTAGSQANGIVQIVLRPRWLAQDYGALDSNGVVAFTTNASTLTDTFMQLDTGGAVPVGINLLGTNTEYDMASLVLSAGNNGITYRIVGAGIRIKYTGPVLNESGLFHCVTEPDHASLDRMQFADYSQLETYFSTPISKEWTVMTYTPVLDNEFHYLPDWHVNAGSHAPPLNLSGDSFNACIGIVGKGTAVGDYYQFEAIVHYEVTGKIVRQKTATTIDMNGTTTMLNSITPDTQKLLNEQNPVASIIKESPAQSVNGIMETVKGVVNSIGADKIALLA